LATPIRRFLMPLSQRWLKAVWLRHWTGMIMNGDIPTGWWTWWIF